MEFANLDLEEAERNIGQVFEVDVEGYGTLRLRLDEASPIPTQPEVSLGFSLVFSGPAEPVLAQGMYALRHEGAESDLVFLVPISSGSTDTQYEAVFTRLE